MLRMSKSLQICVLMLLVIGILCGCAGNNALDSQYPPHYEKVYESLYGADLQEVATALGYSLEQLEVDPLLGYTLPGKVSFLDHDFTVCLSTTMSDNKAALISICYYLELDPQTGGKTIENIGETLQKMFGYQYRSENMEGDGFRDFDPNELTAKLNGTEPWTTTIKWLLTEDVDHLPQIGKRNGITLAFKAAYDPANGVPHIMLTYQYDVVAGNLFVK